jgi:hypothetical protein
MIMELVSAIISFLIAYYALKGYKASSERGLFFLHFGFVILGVSMLLRVITTAYVISIMGEESLRPVIEFARIVYPSIKLIAYTLFAITCTYETKITSELKTVTSAAAIFLLFYNPFLELVATVLLAYVMVRSIINSAMKRSSDAILVSLGFSCMFISHLFFLFATNDGPFSFMLGHFINLIGFLFLLIMLMQVSKAE